MTRYANKFNFLIDYNPLRGGVLDEGVARFSNSNFQIIGICKPSFQIRTWDQDENGKYYQPVKQDFLYIWADIGRLDPKNWWRGKQPTDNELKRESIGISLTKDLSSYDNGSIRNYNDNTNDVSKLEPSCFEIYPQYQDTAYGNILCRSKNQQKEELHTKVMQSLDIRNGFLILKHNSPVKITDGIIQSKGTRQGYSSRSDYNNYYWASKEIGPDQSGMRAIYCYYCFVNPNDFYDLSSNLENLSTEEALKKYKYCGIVWKDNPDWIAAVDAPAKITFIRDLGDGGKAYDANWNEINPNGL